MYLSQNTYHRPPPGYSVLVCSTGGAEGWTHANYLLLPVDGPVRPGQGVDINQLPSRVLQDSGLLELAGDPQLILDRQPVLPGTDRRPRGVVFTLNRDGYRRDFTTALPALMDMARAVLPVADGRRITFLRARSTNRRPVLTGHLLMPHRSYPQPGRKWWLD